MLPFQPATVAEALLQVLDQAAAAHGRACLAIPGGRSPGPVLREMARQCTPFLRQRLHLLWADERAVPPAHAERNDAPTLAAWSEGGALPAAVHAMPAELPDLDAAAAAYAVTLAEASQGRGCDAVLLGMGEDGHVASLFPDHPGLDELDPVFAIRDAPKPPPCRLSLSLGELSRARLIAVLALGAGKREATARWRRGGRSRSLPVSLLPAGPTVLFADEAAAG